MFQHTKALEFINLENNNIHGSIPLDISHLSKLETLVLKKNNFEGIVPFEQLASTSVKYLGLSYNRFSSKLERAMKEMMTLEHIYLDHNEMRGPIPDHIGALTNLSKSSGSLEDAAVRLQSNLNTHFPLISSLR